MSEIKEALDRASLNAKKIHATPFQLSGSYEVKQTLLALIDALVEIAAVLPAPYTVPKEADE